MYFTNCTITQTKISHQKIIMVKKEASLHLNKVRYHHKNICTTRPSSYIHWEASKWFLYIWWQLLMRMTFCKFMKTIVSWCVYLFPYGLPFVYVSYVSYIGFVSPCEYCAIHKLFWTPTKWMSSPPISNIWQTPVLTDHNLASFFRKVLWMYCK